jgi:CTP:molybdopterin cytidylyltransferase MocA
LIPSIILAAGRSARMGRSKALLIHPATGATFIASIAATLIEGGADDVLVVTRPEDAALKEEVDRIAGHVRIVENPHADEGQLSSLITGLNAADHPGTRGILVTPVDLPLIRAATVRALLAAFPSAKPPIVRATHKGQHGHPVIFARAVFDALRRADPSHGARAVVRANTTLDIEVDDPGVLMDVDTPDDYAALS